MRVHSNMAGIKSADTLPLILTPLDIAEVLALSRNTVYELLHSADFPAFKVGKQYRVSREKFLVWLDTVSENKNIA